MKRRSKKRAPMNRSQMMQAALSSQTVLLGQNCENAAKMALWLCSVILYGYGNAAKSEPVEIA